MFYQSPDENQQTQETAEPSGSTGSSTDSSAASSTGGSTMPVEPVQPIEIPEVDGERKYLLTNKARQEAIGRVRHKILELNDGGYKDSNNRYWAILARNNNLMPSSTPMGEYYAITLPYIASREIAEQIIEDHEADLKIIFNIK